MSFLKFVSALLVIELILLVDIVQVGLDLVSLVIDVLAPIFDFAVIEADFVIEFKCELPKTFICLLRLQLEHLDLPIYHSLSAFLLFQFFQLH